MTLYNHSPHKTPRAYVTYSLLLYGHVYHIITNICVCITDFLSHNLSLALTHTLSLAHFRSDVRVCECARFPAARLTWFLFLCLFPSVRACVCLFSLSFLLSPTLSLSPSAVRALFFLRSLCTHIEEHDTFNVLPCCVSCQLAISRVSGAPRCSA